MDLHRIYFENLFILLGGSFGQYPLVSCPIDHSGVVFEVVHITLSPQFNVLRVV